MRPIAALFRPDGILFVHAPLRSRPHGAISRLEPDRTVREPGASNERDRMSMQSLIETRLREKLAPSQLSVIDESHLHAGHTGWREGGETHYRVEITADAFTGQTRVARHRMVNAALTEAFDNGLHALAVKARAPGE